MERRCNSWVPAEVLRFRIRATRQELGDPRRADVHECAVGLGAGLQQIGLRGLGAAIDAVHWRT